MSATNAAASGAVAAPTPGSAAPSTTAAAPAQGDLDAGVPDPPDASHRTPSDTECSAELASCLLQNPLNYAECLRENADHGCPEPDAGTSATTPVTGPDGKPISTACQAELANCIMRNPTPANAEECTETARKCK
jgi:hypothetical protein